MNAAEVIALEQAFQIPTYAKMPIALARGAGSFVWDVDGTRYLDYYGGHCVTALGHCPPPVVEAVRAQAGELLFYSNMVFSPVRARAAERLASVAPMGMQRSFFCNSGSEANETALKLARKYTGRPGVIAMEGSFHGRTLGSLAVTWPAKYREPYAAVLPETVFVPYHDADAVESVLQARGDIAAVIVEPVQWAGMWTPQSDYFERLRALCDRHGCVLIFDEVQTGVGRTGTFSIADLLGVRPDLITMAKSLGSGLPVGTVLVSEPIAETVQYGDQGTTFGGGMLAMAAVEATIRTIVDENLMAHAVSVFKSVRARLAPLVKEVRGRGCLIGFEVDRPVKDLVAAMRSHGVLAGTTVHPNVVRIMPPLNTTQDEVDLFCDVFASVLSSTNEG